MNFLYYSNQSERLTHKLAELIAEKQLGIFQKELVLIQAAGMESYLSLALAEKNGICSGVKFCFTAPFLKELLALKSSAPFPLEPEQTAWLIWELLASSKIDRNSLPSFIRKNFYSGQASKQEARQDPLDKLKQYHFAYHLAHLFNRYLLYAPEWTEGWQAEAQYFQNPSKGKTDLENWQAHIWAALCREYPELNLNIHLRNFFENFFEKKKKEGASPSSALPKRIFVFCISLLPPLVEKILLEIASSMQVDVHWFFLEPGPASLKIKKEPSNLLWKCYDKIEERLPRRIYSQIKADPIKGSKSKGSQARGILSDLCQELPGASLLKSIQKALYNNRNGLEAQSSKEQKALSQALPIPIDASLCIQNCHSPLREVEVLHDWLLDQFAKNPKLYPEDILVLSPEPELYAPFIEAVFSNAKVVFSSSGAQQEARAAPLPYSLRDTAKEEDFSFAEIFFKLMELGNMRFEAAQVFAIINNPWIAKKAGLSLEDLEKIRKYIIAGAICWGLDAKQRMASNLGTEDRHTFKEGLSRLFLSYALPPDASEASIEELQGLSSVLDIEGENARLLGDFAALVERLAFYAQKLRGLYRLSQWALILSEMEQELLLETSRTDKLLEGLHEAEKEGGFSQLVDIAPVQACLKKHQDELVKKRGFGNSQPGIQFAALSSMRAVPSSVICLLGMNESDFPRREKSYEFDLLASQAQAPLSQSHQDRLLFLELLLSARSQFYISYVGQSQHRPNENFAPSVLVSELGSYIDKVYTTKQGASLFASLIQKHPLQNFNPLYFSSLTKSKKKKNELFSYAKENCKAAQSLYKAEIHGAAKLPFWDDRSRKLRKTEDEHAIEFQDLLNFFRDPAKDWLLRNLEFSLSHFSESKMPAQEEPLSLDSLENYKLNMYIIKALLQQKEKSQAVMQALDLRARSHLPHGNYGKLLKTKLWEEALAFSECVLKYSKSSVLESLELDFSLTLKLDKVYSSLPIAKSLLLTGKIEAFSNEEGDLVFFSYAKFKGDEYLKTWIIYLAWYLCSSERPKAEPDQSKRAYLICRNENKNKAKYKCIRYELNALERTGAKKENPELLAHSYLAALCTLYLCGLEKPLCYFNESSWIYASTLSKPKNSKLGAKKNLQARYAAQKRWQGDPYNRGEGEKPSNSLCFRQHDPFQEEGSLYKEFQELSLQVGSLY